MQACQGFYNLKLSLIPAMSVYTILDLPNLLEFATEQEIPTNVGFVQEPKSQMINLIRGKYLIKLKTNMILIVYL